MSEDALRLFDEDRKRFLALYVDFLRDHSISRLQRVEEARATENALRQINTLHGVVS